MVARNSVAMALAFAGVGSALVAGAHVARADEGPRTPLSKDDVLTLVDIGVSEEEVARQIDARGATIDPGEIPALRAKLGAKIADALERKCKPASQPLTKGELLRLIDLKVNDEEIARLVAKRGVALSGEELAEVKGRLPEGSKLLDVIAPRKRPEPVSSDEVVALTKKGVAAADIIARIEASDSRFALTTDQLLALRKDGVDPQVLKVMVARKGPAEDARAPQAASRFVHATYAFAIERPEGFDLKQKFEGGEHLDVRFKGPSGDSMNVSVVPIRDRSECDDESLLLLHQQYVEEEFDAKPAGVVVTRVGNVTYKGFEGEAIDKEEGNARVKYRTFVGLSDEAVVYVSMSAKVERWEKALPVFQRAVSSLTVPAIPEIRTPRGAPELSPNASNSKLAKLLKPSVVHVRVHDEMRVGDRAELVSFGTGFVVHEDGYVLTNRHVVQEGRAGEAGRRLHDAFQLTWDIELKRPPVIADLIGVSERYDVACLKIRNPGPYQPVPLADVNQASGGDHGLVLGFPRPMELTAYQMNTNDGTISAIEKDPDGRIHWIRHVIQTDQGNSGGPVIDTELGGVIGLHTQSVLVRRSGDARETPHATAWRAVPIHQAIREFPQIVAGGRENDLTDEDRTQRLAFYFGQQRWGSVAVEARRILQSSRSDKFALAYLGHVCLKQGDRQRTLDCVERLLRDHDDDCFALKRAVMIYMELGQFEEAARWADRLAENVEAKKDAEAQVVRAVSKLRAKQYVEALERLHDADKLAKGRAAPVALLQASVTWQKAIADKQVYEASGKRYVDPNVKERIERFCRNSLAIKPRANDSVWTLLAEVARFENDTNKALDYCQKGLATSPRSAALRLKAARILMDDAKGYEKAVPLVSEALELEETARAYSMLGEAFFGLALSSRTAKAASEFFANSASALNRSLELEPRGNEAPMNLFLLGVLHEKLGNRDEAVNCYRRCVDLKPEQLDVNERLFRNAEDRIQAIRGVRPTPKPGSSGRGGG